jgi:hypothetical protein
MTFNQRDQESARGRPGKAQLSVANPAAPQDLEAGPCVLLFPF